MLKAGLKCVVVANNSHHGKTIGSIVKLSNRYNGGGDQDGWYTEEFGGTWFSIYDLKPWEQNKLDLKKELEECNSKILILETKIKYLSENNKEVVNGDEYKEYCLTKIIESDVSSREKADAILELLEDNPIKAIKIINRPKRKEVP